MLSLQRGAVRRDPVTGLHLLHGQHWKGVTDQDGTKLAPGEVRADPWAVHRICHTAIDALERLHHDPWLWPDSLFLNRRHSWNRRVGAARTGVAISRDILAFADWVNACCVRTGRADTIPTDPSGPITASRFRRTLAWHIMRWPCSLVAAAIQYGHLQIRLTQNYSNPQELHQTGEEAQVARSRRRLSELPETWILAV